MRIHIYLKYKYTYQNAAFCTLCIDYYSAARRVWRSYKFASFFGVRSSAAAHG